MTSARVRHTVQEAFPGECTHAGTCDDFIFGRDTSEEALAVADLRALLAAPLPVRSVRESLLRRALTVLEASG
jgi:hypothetical protein